MRLADGIRKHGFRKWYERELLQSHAHLALTFICMAGVFGALESTGRLHSLNEQAGRLLTLLLCCAVGLWALRRYLTLLSRAESTAHQARCPGCDTYARFDLVRARRADGDADAASVRCRQCARAWEIIG